MLRTSLNAGSSMDASLKVLRNQNASAIQCIKAVRDIWNLDLVESKRVVLNSSAFSDVIAWQDITIEQIESDLMDD